MKSRFFERNKDTLQFEWNAAKPQDWRVIQRNFVAAYLSSYRARSFAELQYDEALKYQAELVWESAYAQGQDKLMREVIKPLQYYLGYEKNPLHQECVELSKHFQYTTNDISAIKAEMIKLTLLRCYFENDYHEEKHKIDTQAKKIDYLITRFQDQPIAFFVSEYNYKSAHVYLRFVTLSPTFHRLGLGERILDEVVKRYPDATGLELYTRKANHVAQAFYKYYGFKEFSQFDFGKPDLSLNSLNKLYFPDDDATSHPEAFIGFSKLTQTYRG